jgi:hypothetical protein
MTPVSFHDARVVRGDATLIRLSADSCKGQPYQVRISESAREVRIALAAATPEGPPFPACSDLVAVRLKKPLGSRRLWTPPPIAKCLIEQDRTFSPSKSIRKCRRDQGHCVSFQRQSEESEAASWHSSGSG